MKQQQKWIDPSAIQKLRSCATYVTRVKRSLLASNKEQTFNAFLDLLCSWSDQGLSSQEVFSQMQLILQDASPELLVAFTAFLPVDAQEEARLHLVATTMPTRGRAQEEIEGDGSSQGDASSSGNASSSGDSCFAAYYTTSIKDPDKSSCSHD